MKKIKDILLIVCVMCISLMLCGCSDKNDIKALISDYEKACNALDVDGMLNCLDPDVEETINSTLGFIGLFADVSTEEMLDTISKWLIGDGEGTGVEMFASIQIKVNEMEVGKATAVVDATVSYEMSGESYEKPVEIKCEYTDDLEKWYISDWTFK